MTIQWRHLTKRNTRRFELRSFPMNVCGHSTKPLLKEKTENGGKENLPRLKMVGNETFEISVPGTVNVLIENARL